MHVYHTRSYARTGIDLVRTYIDEFTREAEGTRI
jgi:hypothetical protein